MLTALFLALGVIASSLAFLFVSPRDELFPLLMLTTAFLTVAMIDATLPLFSELWDREQSNNGSPNLDDENIRRGLCGSERQVEIVELNCNNAFQSLTATQRKYAHYMTKAFFDATLSVYFEMSTETAGVFIMLYRLFAFQSMDRLREIAKACNFTKDEWNDFIAYSTLLLSNTVPRSKIPAPIVNDGKLKNLWVSSEGVSAGTRLYYAPILLYIYHPSAFPRPDKISNNIQEYVESANRKSNNSLDKLNLHCDENGCATDPEAGICVTLYATESPEVPEHYKGFVGIFNMATNETFSRLTNNHKRILKKLPWGKDYENDDDTVRTLTSFDLIAFAFQQGRIYGETISKECFRVYRNLLSHEPNKVALKEEDLALVGAYKRRAREVQTALHELFGHGSGKLFKRSSDGTFNFDKDKTVDILTGGSVTSWYEPGETYESVFGDIGDAFEECKAEAVGYVLSCDAEVLKLFGYSGREAENIKYTNCLNMADAGFYGLMTYDVENKEWGTFAGLAHCWARFVLLKVVLEAGQGYLAIEQTKDSNGDCGLSMRMDSTKIDSVGVPAVREFLKKLQALKSTANVKGARALFDRYSVGPTELEWRAILQKTTPTVILQPNTVMNADESVELKRYPVSPEGLIQSVVERYTIETIDEFEKLWRVEMEKVWTFERVLPPVECLFILGRTYEETTYLPMTLQGPNKKPQTKAIRRL